MGHRTGRTRRIGVGLALALLACGPEPSPTPDAGPPTPDTGPPDAGPPAFTEPAPPAPPVLTPCPDGWGELALEGGPAACHPFPDGLPDCAETEILLPGRGCEPLGPACDGPWPTDLPTDVPVRFVAPGGTGDGTRAAPLGSISAAVALSAPGDLVAVAQGTYVESVALDTGAVIVGACVGATVIQAPASSVAAIEVTGLGGAVRHLTLDRGLGIRAAADVDVENVLIRESRLTAVQTSGGTLTGRRLKIQHAASDAMLLGSATTLTDVEIVDTDSTPVRAVDGAAVAIDRVTIRLTSDSVTVPRLAAVLRGASLTLEHLAVVEAPIAFFIDGAGSALTIRDSFLDDRDTLRSPGGPSALAGTSVTLERVRVVGGALFSLGAGGPGARLVATDVIAGGGFGEPDLPGRGYGIELSEGADASLDRVWIEDARAVGILLDRGSTLAARDLTVRATRANEVGSFGRAIQVQTESHLEGTRVALLGGHELQLGVADRATATLVDARLDGVGERACAATTCADAPAGIGAGAYTDGQLELSRFAITDGPFVGVQLSREGAMDLRDGLVGGHAIGVNVQVEGYDLDRLTTGVRFLENGRNLDQSALPVPTPALPTL